MAGISSLSITGSMPAGDDGKRPVPRGDRHSAILRLRHFLSGHGVESHAYTGSRLSQPSSSDFSGLDTGGAGTYKRWALEGDFPNMASWESHFCSRWGFPTILQAEDRGKVGGRDFGIPLPARHVVCLPLGGGAAVIMQMCLNCAGKT